ncbi:hypothetical protein ACB098_02G077300 [Castanea mollissima]
MQRRYQIGKADREAEVEEAECSKKQLTNHDFGLGIGRICEEMRFVVVVVALSSCVRECLFVCVSLFLCVFCVCYTIIMFLFLGFICVHSTPSVFHAVTSRPNHTAIIFKLYTEIAIRY